MKNQGNLTLLLVKLTSILLDIQHHKSIINSTIIKHYSPSHHNY